MPQWRFWGTLAWGAGVAITFIVLQIVTVLALARFSRGAASESGLERLFEPTSGDSALRWFGALAAVLVLSDLLTVALGRPVLLELIASLSPRS